MYCGQLCDSVFGVSGIRDPQLELLGIEIMKLATAVAAAAGGSGRIGRNVAGCVAVSSSGSASDGSSDGVCNSSSCCW